MILTGETHDILATMRRVNEGLLVATSLTNVLFLNTKDGQLSSDSFLYNSSSESVTTSQLCIGLLEVIGNLDFLIESAVQSHASLCKFYQPPVVEQLDYDVLLQNFIFRNHDNIAKKVELDSQISSERNLVTTSENEIIEELQDKTSDSFSIFLENCGEKDVLSVLVTIVESLWLIQSLINTLLGITRSDLQRFEKPRHDKVSQKKKKKTQKSVCFSKNVLRLVASDQTVVKTLFSAGLPRCLRMRSVLYALHTFLLTYIKENDSKFPLFLYLQNKPCYFLNQTDELSFELSYYLTQIGLVILAEDISCDFVRSTALNGLELLCFSQDTFGVELLLIGLRKAQLDGTFIGDVKKNPKALTQNASPPLKSKRLSGFRCSVGQNQMVEPQSSILDDNNEEISLKNNSVSTSYACSHCQTHWYNVRGNGATFSKCFICEQKTLHTSSSMHDTYCESLKGCGWTSSSVVTFSVPPVDYITHELDNIVSQLSCVITCLRRQLSFEHLDNIFIKPLHSCQTNKPMQLKWTNDKFQSISDTLPKNSTAQFSFPAHGWLIRVLEESTDPAVRQASFNLISQVLTTHTSNPLVAELRFKAHLPIFRGLLDSNFQVVQSAIKTIVIASKLAPLKDGAVHRLIAFFASTSNKLWSFIFLSLFEPCCYHDASAIRVLIKGITQIFLREFNSLKKIAFPFSYFELNVPTNKEVNDTSIFFSLKNVHQTSDCLLPSDKLSYWLAASLRLFYMLGFRHASHFTTVSQFYDLQKSNKYSLHDPIIDKDLLSLDITPNFTQIQYMFLFKMLGISCSGSTYCFIPQISNRTFLSIGLYKYLATLFVKSYLTIKRRVYNSSYFESMTQNQMPCYILTKLFTL